MLVRDSITYLLARAVPAILSLASIALLTRLLPAEAYGQYALLLATTGLLNAVFFSWNEKAVFRFHANLRTDLSALLTTGFVGFCLSLFMAALGSGLLVVMFSADITAGLFAAGVLFLLSQAWIDFTAMLLNVEGRAKAYFSLHIGRTILAMVAGGLAAYVMRSAVAVVLAIAASYLMLSFIPRIFRNWLGDVQSTALSRSLMLKLFRYGFPLSLSIALMQVVGTADRLMLAHFSGARAVGEYAAGFDLAQFTIGAIASAFSLASYPQIVACLETEGKDATKQKLNSYAILLLALLLPAAAGLALVSPAVAHLLIGPDLRESATQVMPWICAGTFFAVIKSFYADFAFQLGKWTQGGALTAALTVIINIGLNLILIPASGSVGAAQASLASFACALIVSFLLGWGNGFRLPLPLREAAKILLATAGMALVLWPFHQQTSALWLVAQIFLGAASYAVLSYGLNILNLRNYVKFRFGVGSGNL